MEKDVIVSIRFKPDIYKRIKDIAEKNDRSFGKQVNSILRKYCAVDKKYGVPIIDLLGDYEHDKILDALKKIHQE